MGRSPSLSLRGREEESYVLATVHCNEGPFLMPFAAEIKKAMGRAVVPAGRESKNPRQALRPDPSVALRLLSVL